MAYSTTSKYVQFSPYLVMEYMYADQPNPETYPVNTGSTTVGFNKLINGVLPDSNGLPSDDVQIFNPDQDDSITQNTSNESVVQVTENSFITLNPNLIVPYNDFNPDLTPTANLPITFPSNISVIYDSVRYHILAGYNLDNIDGIILQIQYLDVDGSYVTFSQIKLSKGTAQSYTLNPNPLTIGSNIYDKYFEIKIPSLVDMNNSYSAATPSNRPNTLAGKTSKSGNGYVTSSPIRIRAYEILKTSQTNGYATYGTQLIAALSLESTDPFQELGAYIAPADTGDFFEYFATENGGFAENFILFQNSIGNSYYVDNKLEVLEQVGAALINTSTYSSIQTTAYDVPNLFRPIVRYASVATSFTLRYTMTLINSKDQSRLVRISTYTSSNPSKYGPYIAPLTLSVLPQQLKIYNKVAGQTNISVPSSNRGVAQVVKYANVFVDTNLVNTTISNLSVEGTSITDGTAGQTLAVSYGMGQAYVTISPFDNYYKFTFSKKASDGTTENLDLQASGTFSMVFVDNKGNKVSAPSITDINLANAAKGELAFKVDEALSMQILQFTDRKFYITNRPVVSAVDPTANGLSKVSSIKQLLAKKAFSLNDSIKEVQLASSGITDVSSNGVNTARISGKSSSVMYWGNWLKDGEVAPNRTVTTNTIYQARGPVGGSLLSTSGVGKSSWQTYGSGAGSTSGSASAPSTPLRGSSVTPKPALTPSEVVSSITSDVQGQIARSWSTVDIISYFLDPSSSGYKLYGGVTKETFTKAVTGIFSNQDLLLVNKYGNTRAGLTNGGPAAAKGSQTNQTGGDNGSANIPQSFQ